VMGIYMLVFAGGTPLGAPLVGWISQEFGARWGLIGGGVISAGAGAVVLALSLRRAAARGRELKVPELHGRSRLSGPATGPVPVPASAG